MSGLKRAAIVFAVVAVLLFADGAYLIATHNEVGGDTGVLFGNPHFFLSAGTVVVISGLLLLVASVIMWLVEVRREPGHVLPAATAHPLPLQVPVDHGLARLARDHHLRHGLRPPADRPGPGDGLDLDADPDQHRRWGLHLGL
jgi:hypothetical protein